MSDQNSNDEGGFFSSVGDFFGSVTMDDFSTLAGHAIEYEKAKNSRPERSRQAVVELATTPQIAESNPNIQPVSAAQMRGQMQHQGFGSPIPFSQGIDKNILYAAGAVLAGLLVMKVARGSMSAGMAAMMSGGKGSSYSLDNTEELISGNVGDNASGWSNSGPVIGDSAINRMASSFGNPNLSYGGGHSTKYLVPALVVSASLFLALTVFKRGK